MTTKFIVNRSIVIIKDRNRSPSNPIVQKGQQKRYQLVSALSYCSLCTLEIAVLILSMIFNILDKNLYTYDNQKIHYEEH